MTEDSSLCPVCGQSHAGAFTDYGFEAPDDVASIPQEARAANVKITSELCQIAPGRNFIRCVLQVPFVFRPGFFGWGVWAEVEWPAFQKYLDYYETDAGGAPVVEGKIANQLPFDEPSVGAAVQLQFGDKTKRPVLRFARRSKHYMADHQKNGYNPYDYHLILAGLGQL